MFVRKCARACTFRRQFRGRARASLPPLPSTRDPRGAPALSQPGRSRGPSSPSLFFFPFLPRRRGGKEAACGRGPVLGEKMGAREGENERERETEGMCVRSALPSILLCCLSAGWGQRRRPPPVGGIGRAGGLQVSPPARVGRPALAWPSIADSYEVT